MSKEDAAAAKLAKMKKMAKDNAAAAALVKQCEQRLAMSSISGDPIKKKIGQSYNESWVDYFKMETFVTITARDRVSKKVVYSIKDKELHQASESISIPANSEIQVNLWSRAEIINEWGFFDWSGEQEILTKEIEFVITSDAQGNIESSELIRNVQTGLTGDDLYENLDINISAQVNAKSKSIVIDGSIILPDATISNSSTSGKWSFSLGGKLEKKDVGEVGGEVGYESGQDTSTVTYSFAKSEITPVTRRIYINFTAPSHAPNQGGSFGNIWFDVNKADLKSTAVSAIDQWWVKESSKYDRREFQLALADGNYTIIVEGYADRQGTDNYNKDIGLRRAQSVINHLKKSIPGSEKYPNNFNKASYGESQSTANDNMLDRKAHIFFYLRKGVQYQEFKLK